MQVTPRSASSAELGSCGGGTSDIIAPQRGGMGKVEQHDLRIFEGRRTAMERRLRGRRKSLRNALDMTQ
jgi:hypothetical protein